MWKVAAESSRLPPAYFPPSSHLHHGLPLHPINLSWGGLLLPCKLDLEFHYELLESHVPF